jgi:hypothetical protein
MTDKEIIEEMLERSRFDADCSTAEEFAARLASRLKDWCGVHVADPTCENVVAAMRSVAMPLPTRRKFHV